MKLISSIEQFRSKIFTVTEDYVVGPKGFEIRRAIILHPGSAAILALAPGKRILLVRQFRVPARQFSWELPAGSMDEEETPLHAAKRELTEETGYTARKWVKLAAFYPSPGFLGEKMTVFLATDLKEGEAKPMKDERIETGWFRAQEVEKMIDGGKIQDAKTMIGFFTWKRLAKSNPGKL